MRPDPLGRGGADAKAPCGRPPPRLERRAAQAPRAAAAPCSAGGCTDPAPPFGRWPSPRTGSPVSGSGRCSLRAVRHREPSRRPDSPGRRGARIEAGRTLRDPHAGRQPVQGWGASAHCRCQRQRRRHGWSRLLRVHGANDRRGPGRPARQGGARARTRPSHRTQSDGGPEPLTQRGRRCRLARRSSGSPSNVRPPERTERRPR